MLAHKKDAPKDLRHKSCVLAGKLIELSGKAKKGDGYAMAMSALKSGKALKKMKEIIAEQGGNEKIKSSDLIPGEYTYDYRAPTAGQIFHIDNKSIAKIARIAGSPLDKEAGIVLFKSRGEIVKKGEKLFRIYSKSEENLDIALKAMKQMEPVEMRKVLLGVIR